MKTLALANGDLVVGQTGHATINGAAKIRQDMALALGETVGHDRFHPDWGSVLPTYVGQPITVETEALVKAEVARVLQAYMANQQRLIQQDTLASTRSRFDTSDVIARVLDIQAQVNFDSILITVTLQTLAGQRIAIRRTVNL